MADTTGPPFGSRRTMSCGGSLAPSLSPMAHDTVAASMNRPEA